MDFIGHCFKTTITDDIWGHFLPKKSLTFQIFFCSPRLIGLLHLLKFFWLLSMWDICRWLTNSKGQFWPITQTQSFFLHLSFPYKEELVMFLLKDQWTSLGHEPDTLQSLFKTSKEFRKFFALNSSSWQRTFSDIFS